ncbi:hypothetical protein [Gloeothece verrucosa]|uniref:Uncharacterized protein n=1 Tax=Gloeothece verrucosa (strain PCC 7822) TaxID=497965 RepID=E0UAI0_GLOV7|nr:hypothetical protein [Gloeothece verrucosa]ADN12721.1 hypothetical protein Cyan7822_0688 [Gloeothece verrucosa PCC 7822]
MLNHPRLTALERMFLCALIERIKLFLGKTVIRFEQWAHVLLVRFKNAKDQEICRFVSKKSLLPVAPPKNGNYWVTFLGKRVLGKVVYSDKFFYLYNTKNNQLMGFFRTYQGRILEAFTGEGEWIHQKEWEKIEFTDNQLFIEAEKRAALLQQELLNKRLEAAEMARQHRQCGTRILPQSTQVRQPPNNWLQSRPLDDIPSSQVNEGL